MVTWPGVPHLKPFRALRYDPGTVGPLDAVVSPPHDVVTPDRREALVTASPYNAVRLLDPETPAEAGRLLALWQEEGVLVREAEPAVWLLEETFPGLDGGTRTRRGLVARLELTPYADGQVLPHERTFERQKDARLELLRAARTKLSPVFLVHEGRSPTLPDRAPDMEATLDGVTSSLWRVTGRDAIAVALARIEGRFLIADGHHRSAAAARVAAARKGEGSHTYFLSVIFPEREMTILDYNRVLKDLNGRSPEQLLAELAKNFTVTPSDAPVRPASAHEYGMYLAGHWYRLVIRPELVPTDPIGRRGHRPAGARALQRRGGACARPRA